MKICFKGEAETHLVLRQQRVAARFSACPSPAQTTEKKRNEIGMTTGGSTSHNPTAEPVALKPARRRTIKTKNS